MNPATCAARERLLIGLLLADKAAVELETLTETHDCDDDDDDECCDLCTLHGHAPAMHYHLDMYHLVIANDMCPDDVDVAEAREREVRALLDRLIDAPAVNGSVVVAPPAPGPAKPSKCLIPVGTPPRHPDNHPGQERLLAALWDAVGACKEIKKALRKHTCREDPLHGCDKCELLGDAQAMPYILRVFWSTIDGQTSHTFPDAMRQLREIYLDDGEPVPEDIDAIVANEDESRAAALVTLAALAAKADEPTDAAKDDNPFYQRS
jgi:hypothetical protein